jgi:hypothetical protein
LTLVETMIALVVLATGIAAIFGMVAHVSRANRTMVLQTRSVDAYAQLAAEIQNAQCDFNPVDGTRIVDPGLAPGTYTVAVANSAIQHVGVTDGTVLPATVPQMAIQYQVTDVTVPGPGALPALEIEIQISELNAVGQVGDGLRRYPVRKICNARLDETRRGEFL